MKPNLILFTGEEKYLLRQELKRRQNNFTEKFGKDNLFLFDQENQSESKVRQAIYETGLFSSKKMICISGIPLDTDTENKLPTSQTQTLIDELIAKEGTIPADHFLLLTSYKPDKRSKFRKFLESTANIKTFEQLKSPQLKQFIQEQTPTLQRTSDTLDIMIGKIGTNLFHVVHECDKLETRCKIHETPIITETMIENICFGITETNNFEILDQLLIHKEKSLELIQQVQESGTNRNLFLGTLYRGIKMRIFAIDLREQGITDAKELTSLIKAHPFIISKITKNKDKIQTQEHNIMRLYKQLVVLDNDIKSGKRSDDQFRLEIKKYIHQLHV